MNTNEMDAWGGAVAQRDMEQDVERLHLLEFCSPALSEPCMFVFADCNWAVDDESWSIAAFHENLLMK